MPFVVFVHGRQVGILSSPSLLCRSVGVVEDAGDSFVGWSNR